MKSASRVRPPARKRQPARPAPRGAEERRRLWLMYPARLIQTPVVWELSRKFAVVTNVRQASVTGAIGIVCLELSGAGAEITAAIRWLERLGVRVEPVEINVIES